MSNPFFLLSLIFVIFTESLFAGDKDIQIGMIIDGPWKRNEAYVQLIKNEILELTQAEFKVSFPRNKIIEGNWNLERVKSAVVELLTDNETDLVLTLGVIASNEIVKQHRLNKPVIAAFILDPEMQGIPLKNGMSGIKNLNFIHTPFTSRNTLQDFQSVAEFKNMAFLFNKYYLETIPQLERQIQSLAESMNIVLYPYRVDDSIDAVLEKLPDQVQSVYISPLLHIPEKEFDRLIMQLKKRKLPSFSLLGASEVEKGVYTTNRPDIFPRVARRIALNVQRILLGEEPEKIPVGFDPGEQITINMATAREINIYPKVEILAEAGLINEDDIDSSRTLGLNQVISEAVKVNLDIFAKRKFVSAGSENINTAISELLPQLDITALGLVIDRDRAETSFGSQPERSVSGSLNATQIIYSEPAWANLSIQKSLQRTRESELEQLKLEIALTAVTAFFNVLRTKNFESIQKENLRRTKSNLEMARVRESIGSASPAEIHRWTSELANNRNSVIWVMAEKNIARINLNRLLNRNLKERFIATEQNIYTEELLKIDNLLTKYLRDPRYLIVVQDFLVQEGIKNSPELTALKNAIEAQERVLTSAKNNFWAPTLALQAEYTSLLYKSGAGSDKFQLTPDYPVSNDNFWHVGLNLSFPLISGGNKFAVKSQSYEELEQLRLEYQSASEKIEQHIRSTLYIAYASFSSITQTKLASQAAEKSLKVVQDGYSQGTLSILDLLDAQNTALVSQELASNAVYDFIIDLMTVERATGKLYLQMSKDEKQEYMKRFETFVASAGL